MKHYTLRILLCLLLGVVTTVGVAWGLAKWVDGGVPLLGPASIIRYDGTPANRVDILRSWNGFGSARLVWIINTEHVQYENESGNALIDAFVDQTGRGYPVRYPLYESDIDRSNRELPGWSRFNRASNANPSNVYIIEQVAGWPAPALYSRTESDQVGVFNGKPHRWGFQVSPTDEAINSEPSAWFYRVIPFLPIFPGFIINMLFYGTIWLGLFLGIGAARRSLRRKRGYCPKCGYNLRGDFESGCSECGWKRKDE